MPEPVGRLVGYARVSTNEQDEQMQTKALLGAGVTGSLLFTDHGVSGNRTSRQQLDLMLAVLDPGDVVVVWALDRLGRNAGHVITLLADLRERRIYVRSLRDGLDTSTDIGEAMLGLLAIFARMERQFIILRTRAGIAAARAAGRIGGRPRVLDTSRLEQASIMRSQGTSVVQIARTLGVSTTTLYRHLKSPT